MARTLTAAEAMTAAKEVYKVHNLSGLVGIAGLDLEHFTHAHKRYKLKMIVRPLSPFWFDAEKVDHKKKIGNNPYTYAHVFNDAVDALYLERTSLMNDRPKAATFRGFTNYRLSIEEKKAFALWLEKGNPPTGEDALLRLCDAGFKVTSKYQGKQENYLISVQDTDAERPSGGLVHTTYAADLLTAVLLAFWKLETLFGWCLPEPPEGSDDLNFG